MTEREGERDNEGGGGVAENIVDTWVQEFEADATPPLPPLPPQPFVTGIAHYYYSVRQNILQLQMYIIMSL